MERKLITIQGAVQGVGFRPFVFKLAESFRLKGFVRNSPQGVEIDVEGAKDELNKFLNKLQDEKPPHASIASLQYVSLDPVGAEEFKIMESEASKLKTTLVLPDIAACPECLKEIFEKNDRRYLYPFANCTHCGPRYTIINDLPYDRKYTSMKKFKMCRDCQKEYDDPENRRFHAQPNACPQCGPQLALWDTQGKVLAHQHDALLKAVEGIGEGKVVAVKGLGGFHLMVDATNEKAVQLLRKRKAREEKPFALMVPSLDVVDEICFLNDEEEMLLTSPASPIVLLKRKEKGGIAPGAAPNNPYLGVMLPYTPLHHILMKEFKKPVVATSGNISDEPICIDNNEALSRLKSLADLFLMHDRPIARHCDDSIVREMKDRPLVLRRARGYAPLPILIGEKDKNILAVGAHLKNTIALKVQENVFVSQHIGDLETEEAMRAFRDTIDKLKELYEPEIDHVVCDLHPEYLSTKFALESGLHVKQVQHHYAHIASCMAENQLEGEVLGIAWDGTGYGTDGTIWGGEFLKASLNGFKRVGHLRAFRLPGGDAAIKEPRRTAYAILREIRNDFANPYFSKEEISVLEQMLEKDINCPQTTSMGRLFDAVSSLLNICQVTRFEGQAAMYLEYALNNVKCDQAYSVKIDEAKGMLIADWSPMILSIIKDIQKNVSKPIISAKFHNTVVEMAVEITKRVGIKRVCLSGGCFQNKYLTERLIDRLTQEGFKPYWHQWIPPNDGGIALGQAAVIS